MHIATTQCNSRKKVLNTQSVATCWMNKSTSMKIWKLKHHTTQYEQRKSWHACYQWVFSDEKIVAMSGV